MAHKANIYFEEPDYYALCIFCGWKTKMFKTPYEAEHARTIHRVKTSLNLKHFWYLLKAYRYGYKQCPCRSSCEGCSGFGFLPTKGSLKFSEEYFHV